MTFRRSLLTLTFPALSLVVAGCNPPIDEAGKNGAAAPPVSEPTRMPTANPAPVDAKPKGDMPAEGATSAPAPAEKPAEAPKADGPTMEPPK